MFSKENIRNRITLVAILLIAFYLFAHQGSVLDYIYSWSFGRLFIPGVVYLIVLLGYLWVSAKKFDSEKFFTVLNFPAVSMFILSIFLELIISDQGKVGRITSVINFALLSFFLTYVLMLTSNILELAYQKDIPLGQAARASAYVVSIVVQYLGFFVLFSSNVDIFLRYSLLLIMNIYFTYFLVWSTKIPHEETIFSTFIISLVVFLFAFILGLWPVSPEIISLVLSVILYISVGIALEQKETIPRHIWIEYGILIVGIVGLILLSGDWGINGPIL